MIIVREAGYSQTAARTNMESWMKGQNVVEKSANSTGMSATLRGLWNNWTVVQWAKLLSSDGSKFCIWLRTPGLVVWRMTRVAQSPTCWSSSESSHTQWWFEEPCHLLVHCFIRSKLWVFYQDILDHSMFPPAELFGDTGFIFHMEHFPKHILLVKWMCKEPSKKAW